MALPYSLPARAPLALWPEPQVYPVGYTLLGLLREQPAHEFNYLYVELVAAYPVRPYARWAEGAGCLFVLDPAIKASERWRTRPDSWRCWR